MSSTRIDKPVFMMDVKVSRLVDRENLIYVRWNIIKNHAQEGAQDEEGDR